MEEWQEVFVGQIPQGNYQTQVINGEEKGLILDLKNKDHHIVLDFGFVRAIRMLDEGIVQDHIYSESQTGKYKKDRFQYIIYQVTDGEFSKQIQQAAGEYWEIMKLKHDIVVTQSYNIDIITEWEPEITIL